MTMSPAEVAAALGTALSRNAAPGEVRALQRLTGGATKQTWSFDWVCGERHEPLILQQTPATSSAPAATPTLRAPKLSAEQDAALMIVARDGGVPAPVVRLVLEPGDGLGSAYVTERVDGETLGRRIVEHADYQAARSLMANQCGEILARIHRLPTTELPFLATLSPADELAVYGVLLTQSELRHPALEYALRWVRQNLPTHWERRVVHSDFRTGNLIVGADGVRCVLDWEIARLGDPMQDLGVLCMRTWRFGGAGEVGGFGSRDDLYVAYERTAGVPVDPQRVRFWEAFSNLKWAISCVRRGLAKRADGAPASVELCAVGRRLEEPLWDFFSLIEGTPA
jgi:aminoglycoside phosphotransferase (APT) family kinase protein